MKPPARNDAFSVARIVTVEATIEDTYAFGKYVSPALTVDKTGEPDKSYTPEPANVPVVANVTVTSHATGLLSGYPAYG